MLNFSGIEEYPEERFDIFSKFHDTLFSEFEQKLSGEKHVIMKMLSFWEYFSQALNADKVVKKIKKTKTFDAYHEAVSGIFEELRAH